VQQIATCLMFVGDQHGRAEEAMNLYVSLFEDSRVLEVDRFDDGDSEQGIRRARFQLAGRELFVMDSGLAHQFTFTPAVSLFVECEDERQVRTAWTGLADGGQVLMPLREYPFAALFGWCNDRYGVSWQLGLERLPAS
jgi:predicted 3-demethylubiquinone-9 3-methyltransferase (glyoxalase superfamily)